MEDDKTKTTIETPSLPEDKTLFPPEVEAEDEAQQAPPEAPAEANKTILLPEAMKQLTEQLAEKPPTKSTFSFDGKERTYWLYEAGRAILSVARGIDLTRLSERLTDIGINCITLSGMCNLPADQISVQIDALVRQSLMMMYATETMILIDLDVSAVYDYDEAKTECLHAIQLLEAVFKDLWGEAFDVQMTEESKGRPKLRLQVSSNLAVPAPGMNMPLNFRPPGFPGHRGNRH